MDTSSLLAGKILRGLGVLSCLVMMAFLSVSARAATSTPQAVDVGIYLNNIPSVNLKEKKFQVDFNIWFRWKGDKINPAETFKIFNGAIDVKDGLVKKKIGDLNYAMQRVQATIYRNFDVDRYPLDNHTLKIQIEDSNADSNLMSFVPDKDNTNVSPKITVPGWVVGKIESYDSITSYKTTYGDISLSGDAEAKFPRYTFAIDLKRAGYGYFFKYFSILFLAAALTFVAFWISVELIDTRYWLVTSSFFLAAITGMSLAGTLPETESFGLGDMLYNLTMAFVFIATAVMIHNHKLFAGDQARAEKLSRQWGIGLTLSYLISVGLIVRLS